MAMLGVIPGGEGVDEAVFEFTSELWLYPGEAGWYFVTLPAEVADDIDAMVGDRAGFGSIPVEVTVGDSTWKTSVFPDKHSASFVLPVKKVIRQQEHLEADSPVTIRLRHDSTRRRDS
jgi:hypothetical protein